MVVSAVSSSSVSSSSDQNLRDNSRKAHRRRRGAAAKRVYRRSVGRLALAVSATLAALFGSSRAFAKGSAGGIQVKGVSAGSATVQQTGRETRITASSQNTVIDYRSFNLGRRYTADFILPGRNSRILNRIDGATPSHIDGHVLSNGTVYFVNPAGVIFGPTAVIDVAGLYAAAAHLSNQDFLAGINHFTGAQGAVVNNGRLKGDVVALVGRQVTNNGVILGNRAVTVVAGDDVLLGERFGNIYVKVTPPAAGTTPAPGAPTAATSLGSGDMYSLAIVNAGMITAPQVQAQAGAKGQGGSARISGHVDASNATGQGGSITVTADTVAVTGATVDASGKTGGGTILVGGDAHGAGALQNANTTSVDAASSLRADATGDNAAGGKVVVWSDSSTAFHGTISARGGSVTGDGGFVETSGHSLDTTGGSVNASAPHGTPGVWLLDPIGLDITTDPTSTSVDVDLTDPLKDVFAPHDPTVASKVSAAQLLLALNAGTSVAVQTTSDGGTAGNGKITVSAPIGMTGASDATLTLKSVAGIDVNQPVGATGIGKLGVTLSAAGGLQLNAAVTTNGGDFNSQSASFTSNAAGTITAGAGAVNVTTTSAGGPLQIGGGVTAGAVKLSAAGNVTFGAGGVAIHADVQSYTAVDPAAHGAQVDFATNSPTFANSAGAAGLVSFTLDQDLTVKTSKLPLTSGLGNITLKSEAAAVTVDTDVTAPATELSLTGKQGVAIQLALTVAKLTVDAGSGVTTIAQDLTTTGNQAYTGKVQVAPGAINLTSTGGDVSFNGAIVGSIDSTSNRPGSVLNVNASSGNAVFTGGTALQAGDVPLAALNVTGLAKVAGAVVTDTSPDTTSLPADTGLQTYGGGVKLTGAATLKGDDLAFGAGMGIDAAGKDLTVVIAQPVTVGATPSLPLTNLQNLTIGDGSILTARTTIDGSFTVAGTLTFNDPVALTGGPITLTASDVAFNGGVGNTAPVQLKIAGDATLAGDLGSATSRIGDLEITGNTTVSGAAVNVFAASAKFDKKLSDPDGKTTAVTVDATGQTTLGGAVSLDALTVTGKTEIDAPGTLAAPSIATAGAQTYGDKVTLQADAVLQGDQLSAPSIDANGHALGLVFAQALKIVQTGDPTGVSLGNLKSLTVGNRPLELTGSTELDTDLTATADVTFNDPLNVGGAAAVKIKAGTTATFNSTVDGSVGLTVDAAGLTTFKADVGSAGFPSLNVTGATSLAAGASTAHVITSGDQTYGGGLTLNSAANLHGNALKGLGGASVLEANGGAGNNDLTVVFKQNLTVDGAVLKDVNNLTVGDGTGATTIVAGTFQTTGAQVYNDPVKLAAGGVTLKAVAGATGTAVTFNNTVDNAGATAADLELDNTATFAAHVGQQQGALGNVVALDDVKFTVAGDLDVLKLDAGTFDFRKTLANGNAAAGAAVTLNAGTDKIGGDVNLGALDVTGTAAITVAAANVTTTGDQTFHNAVALTHAGDVNFSAGNAIDFNAALTGAASDVKVNSAATATTFNGNVNVDSLVNHGSTTIDVGSGGVTTADLQQYDKAITFNAVSATLKSTGNKGITLAGGGDGASDGANDVTILTTGLTTIGADLGAHAALHSLAVNTAQAGNVQIGNSGASTTVRTTGAETYNSTLISLNGNTTLAAGAGSQFAKVDGQGHDLTITQTPSIALTGDVVSPAVGVGSVVNLHDLNVSNGSTLSGHIVVSDAQNYGGVVALTTLPAVQLTAPNGVTFNSTVNAVGGAGLQVDNDATFRGNVGTNPGGALGQLTVLGNAHVNGGSIEFRATNLDFRQKLADDGTGTDVTLNATVKARLHGDVNVHSLTVDTLGNAAATTDFASDGTKAIAVSTARGQQFNDAVTLTALPTVTFDASGVGVTFAKTLTGVGTDVVAQDKGPTTFDGTVSVHSLDSKSADGTTIATGSITAVTTQNYENDVTLAASPMTLNAAGVTFGGKVDGVSALTVNAGTTNINGNVGASAPLSSLTVNGVTANTGAVGIHTTGDQVYNTGNALGGVQLGGDLALDAGSTVHFVTLQGNDHDLLLKTGGSVVVSGNKPTILGAPALNDNVLLGATGSGDGVNNLTVGVDGDQTLAATANLRWALTTNGRQTFFKPVALTADATLKANGNSPITFHSTVNNGFSLITDNGATGVTNFERPVGNAAALASVDVKGTSLITGGLVHTAGDQHFEHAVTVTPSGGGSTSFLSDAGSVTFDSTLSGVSDVSTTAHNNVTFGGAVTLHQGGASTGSLATSATLTNVNGLLVQTDGSQNYGSPVRVGDVDANTLFAAGGPVTFNFTLFNGVANRDVRVTTAGDTTFAGVVDLKGNLITDGGGLTIVRGGLVRTGGSQDFQDEVHAIAPPLPGNTTFASTGSGDVSFENQLVGTGDVIVNTAGHTRFEQAVTVTSGGLTTDAPGVTNVDGLSVTTDGAQLYGDPVVVGNADGETLFTAGGAITFSQTLAGGHTARNVHVTTANPTTFGGAVTLEGNLVTDGGGNTIVKGGTVQTRGSQDFADAVQAIPAAGIDPAKTTFVSLNDTATAGTIHFHQTLDATGDLTVTSDAEKTFDGAVTVVAGLNAGGNLLSNGAGNSAVNGGLVTTDATQHFTGTVTVNPTASGATTFRSVGNQAITFDLSLTGQSDVTVRTFGTTTFGGQVILTAGASNGSTGSLTTDGNAADVTNVNGGLVRTDGSQHFADDVVVNSANPSPAPATLFESVNDNTVTFDRSVTGSGDVTVTTGGLTTFGGLVNLDGSLTTDGHAAGSPGTTLVKGRLVRTTGPQDFADDVLVLPDASWPVTLLVPPQPVTLFTTVGPNPQPVTFRRTLTGNGDVIVTAAGTTTFGGIVDITGGLTTDGGGDTVVSGGLVRTGSFQEFFDAVQVLPAASIPAATLFVSTGNGPIHFHQQLTGSGDVTVTTGGLTTFDGIVDIGGSLTTNAGGITAVNGGLVNTGGSQDYFDAVTIAARPTLFHSTGNLDVHFHSTLTGPGSATVTTGGTTWFDGYVDIGGSLLTDGGGDTQIGGQLIRTGASQDFADRVVLAPLGAGQPPLVTLAKALSTPVTAFISTGNDTIRFEKALIGTGSADVTTAGLTTFGGKVDITADLFTDGGGDTVVAGGLVRTGGTQDFADDIVLKPDAALQPPEVAPSIPLAGPVTVFVSSGNKDITFERTLTGTGSAEITTGGGTGGLTTLGGPVNITGDLLTDGGGNTLIAGRLVQTGGKQDFFDDVVVTPDPAWGGSDPHGVTGIPASGNTLFASTGNNAITFERTLKGTSNVTVNTGGMTTFKGEVNLVGSLTTDVPGTTTIGDPAGPNPGQVTTTSFQLYNDNVVLGTDVHTTSTGGGDITFKGTVTGPHRLQTSTDGQAIFQQNVDIQSLTTGGFSADPAGSVLVNGHGALAPLTIRTSEYQLYHNPVHLGGDATMTSTGAGDVTFEGTVDGPHNMIVNTAGVTTFFKTVDVGTLVTDAPGKAVLKGGIGAGFTVRTTGYQDYNDDVEVDAATTFLSGTGDIAFHKTLKGDFDTLVTTAGQTTFHGAVDVGSLTTDGGGLTVIGDPAVLPTETIHTTRFQTYKDAVSLGTDALLTAGGDVTFATTVDGPHRLVVNTPADEIFGGAVNIGSLLTDQDHQGSASEGAHGFTRIRGGVVTTSGVQLYGDDVKIETANATLTAGDDVTFFATVKGTPTLTVNNTVHTTTFDGAVDVGALTTDAGGLTNINGGSVNTSSGDQLYQDDRVVLAVPGGGVDKLTSAGNITFNGFVNGDQTATGLDATVAANHTLEFDKDVAVAQLVVEKTGKTLINTAHVKTNGGKGNGGQTYRNAVAFTQDLILTDTAGQSISFEATSSLAERTSGLSLAINTAGDTFIAGNAKVGTFTSDATAAAQVDGARIRGGRTHVSGQLTADKAVLFNDTGTLEKNGQIVSNGSTITFNGKAELSADAGLVQTKVGGVAGAVEFNGQVSRGAGITWVVTHGSAVEFNQLVSAPTLNLIVDTTLALGAQSTLSLRSLQRPDGYTAFVRTTVGQWQGDVSFHQDATVGSLAVTARNVTAHAVSARQGDISLQPDPQLTLFPANTAGQNGVTVEQNFLPYSMQSTGPSARVRRAASGSPTATPGTIPPSTQWPKAPDGVLTLNGSLDASGNIVLAPVARLDPATGKPIVAAAATIQMIPAALASDFAAATAAQIRGLPAMEITAGGSVVTGPQEKLTVLGSLHLQAGGGSKGPKGTFAEISDVSTFGDLSVSAPAIVVNLRSPGNVLDSLGRASNKDGGVDYFAGGVMLFDGTLDAYPSPTSASVPFTVPLDGSGLGGLRAPTPREVAFGITNGSIGGSAGIASYPFHMHVDKTLTVAEFLFQGFPTDTTAAQSTTSGATSFSPLGTGPIVLDATPDGPSSTAIAGVLAQALPGQLPQPTEDENITGAIKEQLKEMGIHARDLTLAEIVDRAIGRVRYIEVPDDKAVIAPEDLKIAASRIPLGIAEQVLDARYEILGIGPMPTDAGALEADWKARAAARKEQIRRELEGAFNDYLAETKKEVDDADATEFRSFVEGHYDRYANVVNLFDLIRSTLTAAEKKIALTPAQAKSCRDALIAGLIPDRTAGKMVMSFLPEDFAMTAGEKLNPGEDQGKPPPPPQSEPLPQRQPAAPTTPAVDGTSASAVPASATTAGAGAR